ncbi:MAG: HD domain-containing protein [Candidatus Thorarchaeota archaeon]|jgi:3'-5' exoribonuclease
MKTSEAEIAKLYLGMVANQLDVSHCVKDILESEDFIKWSASGRPGCHHYGEHGLIIHTYEVVKGCFAMREMYQEQFEIDEKELFLAAFFHDVGKLYDYEENESSEWVTTEHKRNIHHITRSILMWSDAVSRYPALSIKYKDKVIHAISAHHGLREWRSPVSPNSRVAWLLHLCDGISARMHDVDTQDRIK